MTDSSFLPEDYLAKQAERRTNAISLTLFVVVMGAVFGAFLVTNRQAAQVKVAQASINRQFEDAAVKIEELNELEAQKERMLHKAELATALVERVPRSILLAELINRMPERLSLEEFQLKSTEKKKIQKATTRTHGRLSERVKTREEAMEENEIEAPEYRVDLVLIGIAPSDLEVANYLTELNAYALLRDVTLKYSIQKVVDERTVREFRVEMRLTDGADVRLVDPLVMPRGLRNPMGERLRFMSPQFPITVGDPQASVDPETEGGR